MYICAYTEYHKTLPAVLCPDSPNGISNSLTSPLTEHEKRTTQEAQPNLICQVDQRGGGTSDHRLRAEPSQSASYRRYECTRAGYTSIFSGSN
jgi:hypothetical protein